MLKVLSFLGPSPVYEIYFLFTNFYMVSKIFCSEHVSLTFLGNKHYLEQSLVVCRVGSVGAGGLQPPGRIWIA